MNWICEYCCTANDESDKVCFACDNEITEKALNDLRINKLRVLKEKYFSRIFNVAISTAKGLFLVTAAIASLILCISLITMLSGNNVGSISEVINVMFRYAVNNLMALRGNLAGVFTKIGQNVVLTGRDALATLCSVSGEKLSIPVTVVIPVISETIAANVRKTVPVFASIVKHIEDIARTLSSSF